MIEEDVTKAIMGGLLKAGWEIISYDFPQSGTGRQLHPNNHKSKTEGIIIPDIIAYRDSIVLVFENKDHYVYQDFEKTDRLRHSDDYTNDWNQLLQKHPFTRIFYGIGLPFSADNYHKARQSSTMADFIVFTDGEHITKIIDNTQGVFG